MSKATVLWEDRPMKEKLPSQSLYTRWIEIKCEDGTVIKGKRRPTLVIDGQKAKVTPEIENSWIEIVTAQGFKPISITFKYCKR
jgi:hypothetical protein